MSVNMKKMILMGILSISVGANAADLPESATLKYSSNYGIPAIMTFKRLGNDYVVAANIHVPLYKIRFESGGKIENGVLKPSYYRDVRNGKVYASAVILDNHITLGKTGDTYSEKVSGNVMDLFTLSWQLAMSEGKLPANLRITNGKKMYRVGSLKSLQASSLIIDGHKIDVNRVSVKHEDSTIEYGFATNLGNIPAMIAYVDMGKKYNLVLKNIIIEE